MGFLSNAVRSWKKSSKLRELQSKIAPPGQTMDGMVSGFMQSLSGGGGPGADALAEFLDLCEADEGIKAVMKSEGLKRADLEQIYASLRAVGLGQWVQGHYVALSTIAYPEPLLYLVRARKRNVNQILSIL